MENIIINKHYGVELSSTGTATLFYDVEGNGKYKISFKNIKEFKELSDETIAFYANIYVNGRKVGYSENSGKGECNRFMIDDPKHPGLERQILASLAERNKNFDFIISCMVGASLDLRDDIAYNRRTWNSYNTLAGKIVLVNRIVTAYEKNGEFWA